MYSLFTEMFSPLMIGLGIQRIFIRCHHIDNSHYCRLGTVSYLPGYLRIYRTYLAITPYITRIEDYLLNPFACAPQTRIK